MRALYGHLRCVDLW